MKIVKENKINEIAITELYLIHTKMREINQTFKRKEVRFFINGKPISGFLSNYAKGFQDIEITESPKGFIGIILNSGDQYISIPYDKAKHLRYDLESEKNPYLKVDFGNAQFEIEWSK